MARAPRCPGPALLGALAALAAAGCGPASSDFVHYTDPDTEEDSDVVITEHLGEASPCDAAQGCWEDYLDLPALVPDCAEAVSRAAIEVQLQAIEDEEVEVLRDEVEVSVLAESVEQAAGMECLLQDIDQRALDVWVLEKDSEGGILRWRLLFDDPLVGRFTATYLEPDDAQALAAVVAIHGHTSSAEDYLDRYRGSDLADAGMAVVALDMRADQADETESDMTWFFLENSLSFMAVRVYETLLARRFLEAVGTVDPERIGLIAHSGGAVTSNLTLRLERGFAATVTDLTSSYYNLDLGCSTDEFACLIDETTPALYPLHGRINDFDTAPIPVLPVVYGSTSSESGSEAAVDFFLEWL